MRYKKISVHVVEDNDFFPEGVTVRRLSEMTGINQHTFHQIKGGRIITEKTYLKLKNLIQEGMKNGQS